MPEAKKIEDVTLDLTEELKDKLETFAQSGC